MPEIENEAVSLSDGPVVQGFFADVLERIGSVAVRESLTAAVNAKLP